MFNTTSSRQRVHIMKFVTLDRRFVFYVGAGWVGGSVVQIVRIKCFFIINDSVAWEFERLWTQCSDILVLYIDNWQFSLELHMHHSPNFTRMSVFQFLNEFNLIWDELFPSGYQYSRMIHVISMMRHLKKGILKKF